MKIARHSARPTFSIAMSVALVALVAYGFSHTVPGDFTPDFPPFLAVHGAVFAAWMLVFVAQPSLVAVGAHSAHRILGWLALGIAAAMTGLGGYAVIFGLRSGELPPFYPHGLFLTRGMSVLFVFASLVIAGIFNRRKPLWHGRLLLCATVAVTVPALERALPLPLFGARWPFIVDGVEDAILMIGPTVDFVSNRRVHSAYLVGIGAVVLDQLASDFAAPSPLASIALRALGAP